MLMLLNGSNHGRLLLLIIQTIVTYYLLPIVRIENGPCMQKLLQSMLNLFLTGEDTVLWEELQKVFGEASLVSSSSEGINISLDRKQLCDLMNEANGLPVLLLKIIPYSDKGITRLEFGFQKVGKIKREIHYG
jgi:hypothetical protein